MNYQDNLYEREIYEEARFQAALEDWIIDKREEALVLLAKQGLFLKEIFLKCFAYAALNEEPYTRGLVNEAGLENMHFSAILEDEEVCKEYFIHEVENERMRMESEF